MGCNGSTPSVEPDDMPIDRRYVFKRTLGKGASGRVVSAVDSVTNENLAIKIISKKERIHRTLFEREVQILELIDHPGCIHFVRSTQDNTSFYIMTALCDGGELFERIINPRFRMTEKKAAHLVYDMLQGLIYCHDRNIVHRDLKPENYVFKTKDDDSDLVLIDFGVARVVEETKEYKSLVGTVYYIAPELAAQDDSISRTGAILKKSDVWSIGIIAFVMMTGRPPFDGMTRADIFRRIVREKVRFPRKLHLSEEFIDFVTRCLTKNPRKRMDVHTAAAHPWVSSGRTSDEQFETLVLETLKNFQQQSKLKKALVAVLADNATEETHRDIEAHFNRLDKNGDGQLDKKELMYLLADLGYTHTIAEQEAGEIMVAADTDRDDQISFQEFNQMWHAKLLSTHDEYVQRVFQVFDENNDGFIDRRELANALGASAPAVHEMISEIDADRDRRISYAEFEQAMKKDLLDGGFVPERFGVGSSHYTEADLVPEAIPEDDGEEMAPAFPDEYDDEAKEDA